MHKKPKARTYTAHGMTKSIAEWSRHLRVDRRSIEYRLKAGWKPEDAFSAARYQPALYSYDGKTLTIAQWSELTGIDASAIRSRLNIGWSLADALTVPIHGKKRRPAKPRKRDTSGGMGGLRATPQGPAGVHNARDQEFGTNFMSDEKLLHRVEASIATIGRLITERAREIGDQLKALTAPSSIIQVDMESSEEQADGSTLVVLRMRYNREAVHKWLQ